MTSNDVRDFEKRYYIYIIKSVSFLDLGIILHSIRLPTDINHTYCASLFSLVAQSDPQSPVFYSVFV